MVTEAEVLAAVPVDRWLTVMSVSRLIFKAEAAWDERGNVRNRLYTLETQGLIIRNEGRPMRFKRKEPWQKGKK